MTSMPQPVSLYQSADRIHPRRASGRYARLRVAAMLALLGLYYVLPWLTWNGTPLVWFDLPHRRFHLFTLTLVPQDLILLTVLLMTAALTLFFFTTLAGRLWCGYACPQTVWTEAFLWMEHVCEGDRHARMKLAQRPWSDRGKLLRSGGKHLLWLAFALLTGLSFVAYFVPARELFGAALRLELSGWPLFWSLFYGFATWGNAGFLREQVCKYMCPYARFQSVMFDRDTLIVAYDDKRGEPRESAARKTGSAQGDCVDCSLCVQVCPMGIDIRNGLQYECIACAACIDVCNGVMDSVGKPRGLVRYSSARRDEGGRFRLLRPRTIGYGLIWLALCATLLALVVMRSPLTLDVLRDRHSLYRELASGAVENIYVFKVSNADTVAHRYRIDAQLADGRRLVALPDTLERAAGETAATTVALRLEPEADGRLGEVAAIEHVDVRIEAVDAPRMQRTRSARFLTGDPDVRR